MAAESPSISPKSSREQDCFWSWFSGSWAEQEARSAPHKCWERGQEPVPQLNSQGATGFFILMIAFLVLCSFSQPFSYFLHILKTYVQIPWAMIPPEELEKSLWNEDKRIKLWKSLVALPVAVASIPDTAIIIFANHLEFSGSFTSSHSLILAMSLW